MTTLLIGIFSNIVFLVFFALAASIKKSRMGLFTIGAVIQGFSTFGAISRMFRVPEGVTAEDIATVVIYFIFVIGGYFLLKRIAKNDSKGDDPDAKE